MSIDIYFIIFCKSGILLIDCLWRINTKFVVKYAHHLPLVLYPFTPYMHSCTLKLLAIYSLASSVIDLVV